MSFEAGTFPNLPAPIDMTLGKADLKQMDETFCTQSDGGNVRIVLPDTFCIPIELPGLDARSGSGIDITSFFAISHQLIVNAAGLPACQSMSEQIPRICKR